MLSPYAILRYLEDVIPSITYRPSAGRQWRKESNEDQRVFRDYALQGFDDQSIRAIQALSRSDRIDFQVGVNFKLPNWL
jgi:ATP-dependent RNA helicase DHX57